MLIKFITVPANFFSDIIPRTVKIYINNETMIKLPCGRSKDLTCENEDLDIAIKFCALIGHFHIKNIREKEITEIIIKPVGIFHPDIECIAKSKTGKEFHLTNNQASTNAINNAQSINRWL